ncbi:MAG: hypothetical protein IH878_17540 [Gemmatimonadetes bacterium]|nr:hypothetical protein [Gemmatimonadota bacterium]
MRRAAFHGQPGAFYKLYEAGLGSLDALGELVLQDSQKPCRGLGADVARRHRVGGDAKAGQMRCGS